MDNTYLLQELNKHFKADITLERLDEDEDITILYNNNDTGISITSKSFFEDIDSHNDLIKTIVGEIKIIASLI